jgi:50S ribosomal subunit-associated GTPase HflX
MKKILLLFIVSTSALCVSAQTGLPAEQLATKIASKMQDSLNLTVPQQQQVFAINMQLHNQKTAIRNQYSGNDSLIRVNIQRIENKRDSLYRPLIGETNYILYRQKKRNLVNNN